MENRVKKILVTGARGQLGSDVLAELKRRGIEAVGYGSAEMDITDRERVGEVFRAEMPDAVIHCAAYTAVDAAEDNEELCMRVNAYGTAYIAEVCCSIGAKLVYISTDYVFSGKGERPWEPDDEPAPVNVYGISKYRGEEAVKRFLSRYFIVRISWGFGEHGKNFVKTMLKIADERDTITVVDDQIGSPTYTADLAVLLADMVQSEKYGIYHAANSGYCSWYEFAKEIFRLAGREESVRVVPVKSADYAAKAVRPENSRMDDEKLVEKGFRRLPAWEDALGRYLEQIGERAEGYVE